MTLPAINYAQLYREHMAVAGRSPSPVEEWNARAAQMGPRLTRSDYVDGFLARMDLAGCDSLLDVGCGNGALCLPLVARLRCIVALDYSPAMLDALHADARARGINTIDARLCAWQDDWSTVPTCDIVIASRSLQVADMADALIKLQSKARKRVYLTCRVGGHGIPAEIPRLLGRERPAPPDYIYVINLLHGMGIHPRLDYLAGSDATSSDSFDALLRRTERALGALDTEATARLRHWHADHAGQRQLPPPRWAFISWDIAQD